MLNISNISKILGGETLFKDATIQIYPGEKVGLVGTNGAGKSTLFRMIMQQENPDSGQISFPEKMRLAYFSQSVGEMQGRSALAEVLDGDKKVAMLQQKLKYYEDLFTQHPDMDADEMNNHLLAMGEVQTEFEKRGGYDLETRASEVLTGLGIAPATHAKDCGEFSGGQKMRIALAKVLVTKPDLILMDEPTNYLDMETILWLEEWLINYEGSILMTTHDRFFMNNVVKKIVEISNKKITTFSGDYDYFLQEKSVRSQQLIAEAKRQADMLAKEEAFIAKFKARASHAAQVQSRIKKIEKIDRIELPPQEKVINFQFATPPRGGDEVLVIKDLAKTWPVPNTVDKLVFENLNATVKRLDKIAVVGVNGAGKSTLLKVVMGLTAATQGSAQVGPSIKLGYFSQYSLEVLNAQNTLLEELQSALPMASDGHLRNLLAGFLFTGDDCDKKIKYLSGGEKSRLVLAVLLSSGNNFLVLDEPTNHLDIKSREVFLEAMINFEGTLLFVSHDRHFLNDLSNMVYQVDKGKVNIYPGNYANYLSKL